MLNLSEAGSPFYYRAGVGHSLNCLIDDLGSGRLHENVAFKHVRYQQCPYIILILACYLGDQVGHRTFLICSGLHNVYAGLGHSANLDGKRV